MIGLNIKILLTALIMDLIILTEARSRLFEPVENFAFPTVRRGRATPPAPLVKPAVDDLVFEEKESAEGQNSEPTTEVNIIEEMLNDQAIIDAIQSLVDPGQPVALPRSVENKMNNFGVEMDLANYDNVDNFPQLSEKSIETRQDPPTAAVAANKDDDVRCIPKVMQVEELVYDRAIKCQHSFQEKCHMTYITDYQSTTEQKCETTFKKNCHITFKPTPYNETVNICHTPIERSCGSDPVGPEICSTQYETSCETKYTSYDVEQDEPNCRMEIVVKCQNVTVNVTANRRKRQAATSDNKAGDGQITVEEKCENWPVQKCTLEKKTVKKVTPETACKKIPREICIPNNCETKQGEEICRDESRTQVQNVPEEECDLQPEETCHMEAVLVPRLVPQPNCVKVPKEICVNIKTNPRKMKKPVVKQWCYRPSDLADGSIHLPSVQGS